MNYLKQALTELLSGLTTRKNEKEIWIKDGDGWIITVEPIDDECYIIRSYGKDGQLEWDAQYKNDQRHGPSRIWYDDGILACEEQYKNDQLYGISRDWDENGKLWAEATWENGKLIKRIK